MEVAHIGLAIITWGNGTSIAAALIAETGTSCCGVIMSSIHATGAAEDGTCATAGGSKDRAVGSRGDACAWLPLCRLPYPAANPASPPHIVPYLDIATADRLICIRQEYTNKIKVSGTEHEVQ